jgi:hypothetical protein
VLAVAEAVEATLVQEFSWLKQSVPLNADPASETQELNWWVQAAEAADGRSTKTSSSTMNSRLEELGFGRTPGGAPPRERVKMKNVTTSTIMVVVVWAEVVWVVRDVIGVVAARDVRIFVGREVASKVVLRTLVGSGVVRAVVERAVVEFAVTIFATVVASEVAREVVAREVVGDFVVVELVVASVMTQDVAAPLPSTWQTTGCKAAGGHVSWVKDMRYRSHKNVKRLLPTQASGVV